MTDTVSSPARRRPWSDRTRLGVDLAFAVPMLLLGVGWLALDWVFAFGLEVWAAQGDQGRIDAASLAHMERLRMLLIALLVPTVLAAVFRARWTVIAHLLLAVLAGGALTAAQHEWDNDHRAPSTTCVRYSANC
ncbi:MULTISPECIES: DUF6234 family protein [unclassified Streptomyces]|uniref:DUF6234 family protein n=1 Tax=unclassified Streptomyces TaxID=2593676 RepID=UPI0036611BDC